MTQARKGAAAMKPARRIALASFSPPVATLSTAACGLPEKARALVAPRPTPTVAPTPEPTPVPVPPLKMEFVRVREERTRGPVGTPACEIDIELVGAKRSEVESARVLVRPPSTTSARTSSSTTPRRPRSHR